MHKSTPQTLKLREVTGKDDYKADAVGVPAHESAKRSEYEYENYGKKQKGQYSHNSILEWTSAEVWLYLYSNEVLINKAYKKGSARVGCICCPMGGGKASFVERVNYPKESEVFLSLIRDSNARLRLLQKIMSRVVVECEENGQFLIDNKKNYFETTKTARLQ